MLIRHLSTPLLLITLVTTPATASIGDTSPAYQSCISECYAKECDSGIWKERIPWSLRWSRWSCQDDCSYRCSQELTDSALGIARVTEDGDTFPSDQQEWQLEREYSTIGGRMEGLPANQMVQFHGKWPLRRWMGIQEPLSVLFSLLNGFNHYRGLLSLRASSPLSSPRRYPSQSRLTSLRTFYEINAWIGMNLWFWSTIFHTRDKPFTEKGDYFSAALGMIYGLHLFVIRSQGYYSEARSDETNTSTRAARRWKLAAIVVFLGHTGYLSLCKFDYGYNMLFNAVLGVLQILGWITWGIYHHFLSTSPSSTLFAPPCSSTNSITTPNQTRAAHYLSSIVPLALLLLCSSFELLDFPPVPQTSRLLDAHALWHAGTIGVVALWYRFLRMDLEWVEGRQNGAASEK